MSELRPFRFWCQKVLPLVYDDSLSYYELLCEVVEYLNNTMSDVNKLSEEFQTLYNYVHDYFKNLNVQEEINNKLDELVESGRLDVLLTTFIPYITLESFGAAGDGKTDDTDAFIKAINEAYKTGRSIIITEKNFLITRTIDIVSAITMFSISNKKYDDKKGDVNYNLIYKGDGYLFNIHNGVPFNIFSNLTIKGNGDNYAFYVNSHRNNFRGLYLNNFNTCFMVTQEGDVVTYENKIMSCFFESCSVVLRSDYKTGSATDGFFCDNIIILGDYSINCNVLSEWIIARNHDYSDRGMSVAQAVNLLIEGNYFDNTEYTSLFLLLNGVCNITGNKFLCTGNVTSVDKIRLTTQAGYDYSSATVSNNSMNKVKELSGEWHLLNTSVPVSFSGNVSFQQYNLLNPSSYKYIQPEYNSISPLNVMTSTHDITKCSVIGVFDKLKHFHIDVTLNSDVEPYKPVITLKNMLDVGIEEDLMCTDTSGNVVVLRLTNSNTVIMSTSKILSGSRLRGDFTIVG